jgi:tetratricopeptide (TPR) repeat protein
VWFATIVTLALTAMAWGQTRWVTTASGAQVCLALVLVVHLVGARAARVRWAVALASFGVLFAPTAVARLAAARGDARDARVDEKELLWMVYRDIAATLRASQPSGEIRVYASPSVAPALAYYGQFSTLGTLYWENGEGLEASARIVTARTDDEAAMLVRERQLTHIVLIEGLDFIGPFHQLLKPGRPLAEAQYTFGYRLLHAGQSPRWLRALAYRPPDDLAAAGARVRIFEVRFEQSEEDALYHLAVASITNGESAVAARRLDSLIAREPTRSRGWFALVGVHMAQRNVPAAATAAANAVLRAPSAERAPAALRLGALFVRAGHVEHALLVYRAGLATAFDADLGCTLAFTLATATDGRVRNGAEALRLGRRAAMARPGSPTQLLCLAAALAELGQFDEAAREAQRAFQAASASRDGAAQQMAAQLAASFRAKRPWRE